MRKAMRPRLPQTGFLAKHTALHFGQLQSPGCPPKASLIISRDQMTQVCDERFGSCHVSCGRLEWILLPCIWQGSSI